MVSRRHIPAVTVSCQEGRSREVNVHTSKENRKDQDDPKVSPSRSFNGRDTQESNFGGCVEPKAEQDPQRIHFPRTKRNQRVEQDPDQEQHTD